VFENSVCSLKKLMNSFSRIQKKRDKFITGFSFQTRPNSAEDNKIEIGREATDPYLLSIYAFLLENVNKIHLVNSIQTDG